MPRIGRENRGQAVYRALNPQKTNRTVTSDAQQLSAP
jgi:hypothetical protein